MIFHVLKGFWAAMIPMSGVQRETAFGLKGFGGKFLSEGPIEI